MKIIKRSKIFLYWQKVKKKGFRKVCVVSFRREGLMKFLELKETINELLESVNMYRSLDNIIKIKLTFVNKFTII